MPQLPDDLQPLFDTLSQAASDAATADATKASTAQALSAAQNADSAAGSDQLAKHQAVTAAVNAFIAQIQKDYPTS